jgi:DNA repair protein RecO (recombination protein O)
MINKNRTKGFVFKRTERFDSDKAFSVFTQDYGRIEVIARAVRKINSKLRSGIDIFCFSEIEFIQGKKNKTLTDALIIGRSKKNLKDFEIASKISNILDKFLKGQEPDLKLYNLLMETFSRLESYKNKDLLFYYFVWSFLSSQGYQIPTHNCVVCKNKIKNEDIYFSKEDCGILCKTCIGKTSTYIINEDVIKIIRLIINKELDTINILKVSDESKKVLDKFSDYAINSFCPA